MICKTRGIVLRSSDFSDTSIIVKIFTEEFGLQGYLIKGAKRKSASVKANLFHPMAALNLVVYKKENKSRWLSGLQIIREASAEMLFSSILQNPAKTAMMFFLSEILLKSLHEEETNKELFLFVHNSLRALDETDKNFKGFHLHFLLRLTKYLGFFPRGKFSGQIPYFDLREGKFTEHPPLHPDFISPPGTSVLQKLIECQDFFPEQPLFSSSEKKFLLETLLRFYHLHLPWFTGISSHKILKQVFT